MLDPCIFRTFSGTIPAVYACLAKGAVRIPKFYRLNYQIRAGEVRVIDPEGKQLGVMSLQEALARAKEFELDLVEIGPNAQPPVCKIIDYKKFKYERAKAEQEAKKKSKNVEVKEFKVGPYIGANDLAMRIGRMKEFLEGKDRVKFLVNFPGRSITHMELGYEKIAYVTEQLQEVGSQEAPPRREGKNLVVHFVPAK